VFDDVRWRPKTEPRRRPRPGGMDSSSRAVHGQFGGAARPSRPGPTGAPPPSLSLQGT